ncbi:MAG TPA: hypothetical protein VFR75_10610 [Solirubrobacterales bacterium]|nr:hypothetical protein [Solirubrobacterales bacterium]
MKIVSLVVVILAAAAIWIFDPAPARELREDMVGLFLAAVFATGLLAVLLLGITLASGVFAALWGRSYTKVKAGVQEHRGIAVPAFLSIVSGLMVIQAAQAIDTFGSAKAILFATVTVCATGLGTILQERADKYGDRQAWNWVRGIGLGLVILPLFILVTIGLAEDWWSSFSSADGIDQACLVLTFLIEIGTVLAAWALNKPPRAADPATPVTSA